MQYSIIIATYNRAEDLRGTLRSLAGLRPAGDWEVIVVNNNSTDDTRAAVEAAASDFPAPLIYLFEGEQGRSAALNTGLREARGEILLTTDDDVRVEPDWLDQAAAALDHPQCDYIGGKVLPIWSGDRPAWLSERDGKQWAVIALLDWGAEPMELKDRAPLGVNMAFRRGVFERAGWWDNNLGRKAGTLLGQEVREWNLRARRAGLRGYYAPNMTVRHIIPAERLTKRYFRRWFYWHGVSRAMLYEQSRLDMEAPERTTLDFSNVPHIAGVPRYLYRTCLRNLAEAARHSVRGDRIAAFESELWLWFFAGIVRQRWRDRGRGAGGPAAEIEARGS